MTQYIFCFPYRGVGGVPVLFVGIARKLVELGQQEVAVVDYPDGAMAKMAAGSAISLLPYDDEGRVMIPADAILVFQSLNPWAMFPSLQIPDSTRIFFWNCHPFNLVPVFPGLRKLMMSRPALGRFALSTVLRRYRNVVIRFIDFMMERHALVFMDKANLENTESYLGISLPRREYLPVAAGDIRVRVTRPPRHWKTQGLRLTWVGRIADFKYPILSKTLALLDRAMPVLDVPVTFAIVGTGPHLDDLRRDVSVLRNLKVELLGELPLPGVLDVIEQGTDVLFAMGASALEGARLGVPTVLLDISYGPVPDDYVFTWLHDRTGMTLGEVLSPMHRQPGNRSLLTLLRQVMRDFDGVSLAAHAYYALNHSLAGVTEKFLALTQLSNCFYGDFRQARFSARDPVYEGFSRIRKRLVSQ